MLPMKFAASAAQVFELRRVEAQVVVVESDTNVRRRQVFRPDVLQGHLELAPLEEKLALGHSDPHDPSARADLEHGQVAGNLQECVADKE